VSWRLSFGSIVESIAFKWLLEVPVAQCRPRQFSCELGVAISIVLRFTWLGKSKLATVVEIVLKVSHSPSQWWLHELVDMHVLVQQDFPQRRHIAGHAVGDVAAFACGNVRPFSVDASLECTEFPKGRTHDHLSPMFRSVGTHRERHGSGIALRTPEILLILGLRVVVHNVDVFELGVAFALTVGVEDGFEHTCE
jgi:hypothetical protein